MPSLFLGFCCGVPLLAFWYAGLALVRRNGRLPRWGCLLFGLLPLPFVGLATYSEGRYILLDEAIVAAGCEGDVATIERTIAWGADPNRPDDNDGYALPCAVGNGHVAAARTLLRHGANPNFGGASGVARDLAREDDVPQIRRLFGFGPKEKR